MKIRKRIVSVILVVLLICAMVVPASAVIGEYEFCEYNTFTHCRPYDYTALMEFQRITVPGCGKTHNDYSFKVDVRVFMKDSKGNEVVLGTIYGSSSTLLASNYSEFQMQLHHIVAFHYVNSVSVGSVVSYPFP